MKHNKMMKVILAGSFVAAMTAIFLSVYTKKRLASHSSYPADSFDEQDTPPFSSLYKKLNHRLERGENKLKEKDKNFSMPVGEFGLFL